MCLTPEQLGAREIAYMVPSGQEKLHIVHFQDGDYGLFDEIRMALLKQKRFSDIGQFAGGEAYAKLLNGLEVVIDTKGQIVKDHPKQMPIFQ